MHDRTIRMALAVGLGLAVVGCESDGDDGSTAAASEAQRTTDTPEPPEVGQQGQPGPASEPGDPAAPTGPGADQQAAMKQKMEAMQKQKRMREEAIAAAEEAESEGDSRCGKAFLAAVAMGDSLREQQGQQRASEPDEQAFVEACEKLPEQLQRCMLPSYGGQNAQECRQAHQEADPESQQALQAMMQHAQ